MKQSPAARLRAAVRHGIPMPVTQVRLYPTAAYSVCPNCRTTLDREFVAYCDRCGQRLSWNGYGRATATE